MCLGGVPGGAARGGSASVEACPQGTGSHASALLVVLFVVLIDSVVRTPSRTVGRSTSKMLVGSILPIMSRNTSVSNNGFSRPLLGFDTASADAQSYSTGARPTPVE